MHLGTSVSFAAGVLQGATTVIKPSVAGQFRSKTGCTGRVGIRGHCELITQHFPSWRGLDQAPELDPTLHPFRNSSTAASRPCMKQDLDSPKKNDHAYGQGVRLGRYGRIEYCMSLVFSSWGKECVRVCARNDVIHVRILDMLCSYVLDGHIRGRFSPIF